MIPNRLARPLTPNPSINICCHSKGSLSSFLGVKVIVYKPTLLTYSNSLTFDMSLLDQLWDDTVAGPRPESGLGKLRKNSTFSSRSNSVKESAGGNARSFDDATTEDAMKVTRSIMILKPQGIQTGSPPVSPAGSTPPVSPFAGRESYRFRRRSTSDAYEKASGTVSRSPPPPFDM